MRITTVLREANPVPRPEKGLSARGRAELRALVGPHAVDQASEPAGQPVRPRRAWIRLASLATATALAIGLLLMPGLWAGTATAEAKGLLDKAIISAVDPPTLPSQYWKVTTNSVSSDIIGDGEWGDAATVSMLRRLQRITYVAVDGSRPTWFVDRTGPYVRQVSGPAHPLPQPGWRTAEVWTTNLSPREQDYLDILGLPTDAARLRTELYRIGHGRGASDDEEALTLIADVLRTGYAPAELRAALFEVVKTIPGVDVVNRNVTLDGRNGVALGRREPNRNGQRHELILDRETGEFIGERGIFTDPDATIEDAITRELVDRVEDDVVRRAVRMTCTVEPGSGVSCKRPG